MAKQWQRIATKPLSRLPTAWKSFAKAIHVYKLKVKEHHPAYRNLNRNYPGSVFLIDGQVHVMQRVSGSHNGKADGYYDTNGNAYPYYKCKFVAKNEGIIFA